MTVYEGLTPLTPLAIAVQLAETQSVELLLKIGASPDAVANKYGSVLHAATKKRHVKLVSLLLAAKAHTEAKDQAGHTPLLATLESEVTHHHEENEIIVKNLLRSGANANAAAKRKAEGHTITISALHIAVQSGNNTMVTLLTEHHANVEVRNDEDLTPLLAILSPCQRVSQEQRRSIRLLLVAGADGNATGGKYGTALQAAARHGGEFLVHELLQHEPKIDVNTVGGHFGSALQAAAAGTWAGDEVVELLLDHNADASARGGAYGSPLLAALTNGRKKVVDTLLRRGAETEAKHPESGLTALHVAVKRGDMDLVSLLVQHKANTEAVDEEGRTALLVAIDSDNTQLARVLLDGGANVEARESESGRTPLLVASDRGDYDMVLLLLERGADANAEGGTYGKAMRAALYREDVEAQEMIKSFGGTAEMTTAWRDNQHHPPT